MKGLHVRLEGLTASYPYPFLRSGTALTMPMPPYSSIFGMLSACAGRDVRPDGRLQVGFEFTSTSRETIDLEKTDRLKMDPKGRLSRNPEQGIAKRQFHAYPTMDLYTSDPSLRGIFDSPATPPRFGRSQDLAWIVSVVQIDLEPVVQGLVRSTLMPYDGVPLGQVLPPLVDYYVNDAEGRTRVAGRISRYVALPNPTPMSGFPVSSTRQMSLYHPADSPLEDHAVVLMDFQS